MGKIVYLLVGNETQQPIPVEGMKGVTYSFVKGELTVFRGWQAIYAVKAQAGQIFALKEHKVKLNKLHKRDLRRICTSQATRINVSQLGIPSKRCDIPSWLLGYKYESGRAWTPEDFGTKLKAYKDANSFIPERSYQMMELVAEGKVRYRAVVCLHPNCENSRVMVYVCPDITNREVIHMLSAIPVGIVYPNHVAEHILRTALGLSAEEMKQINCENKIQ